MTVIPDKEDKKRARTLALKYLSYRGRSLREMADYLEKKRFVPGVVAETIRYLANLKYLDDARFALSWGAARIRSKKVGRQRLQEELLHKGIARTHVTWALDELYLEEDEEQLARSCVEKKIRGMKRIDPATRFRRLAGYLQRKGFPSHIVFRVLKELDFES